MPRTVNGNSFTENGWPMASMEETQWVQIPGTGVTLQLQAGLPLAIMRAWAADYHEFVEPLRDADSASWTPSNDVLGQPGKNNGSNHLGGSAMDLNWQSHPFHARGTFNAAQLRVIREMREFYKLDGLYMVFWGGDWNSPIDEMHWQMGYGTYNDPRTAQFVTRFIRADGFSTFRRGNAPVSAAPILAAATGLSEQRAAEILPAVAAGLRESEATTVNRIAMWLAQVGHESVSFQYTEEIAKNGRYAPYIGRTWIQITWDYNYRAFSEWCFDRGLVPTRDYFVVNYRELADLKWAGVGASWYWTEQRPMNALVDAGDNATWKAGSITYRGFAAVTAAINGGTNGIDDRRARYNRALAQGDALLKILNNAEDEDEMAGWDQNKVDRAMVLLENLAGVKRKSRSPLHWPHEGDVDTIAGLAWSTDANVHIQLVEKLAVIYGDLTSIALLYAVSKSDDPTNDPELAELILKRVKPENLEAAKDKIAAWLAAEAKFHAA